MLFSARGLPFERILTPIAQHVAINDESGEMIGYVEKYSYCFYPNSEVADKIGYFRYDFHVESMGDGDLGEHTYFHFHRQLDESFRHATGPILDYGEIVSGLEKILAPKTREARLKAGFQKGNFEALLMDLTLQGIMDLRKKLFHEPEWKFFKHKQKYDDFLEAYFG